MPIQHTQRTGYIHIVDIIHKTRDGFSFVKRGEGDSYNQVKKQM